MSHSHDVLIIGRGLAGAVLAASLIARGCRVLVFDRKQAGNASLAAAGIVNPIVFRRDVLSWRANELLPLANTFYTNLDKELGTQCWHPLELVKLFSTPKDVDQWDRAMQNEVSAPFLSRVSQPEIERSPLERFEGHGTVSSSGWLDVEGVLAAQRSVFLGRGVLVERTAPEDDIVTESDGIRIGEYSAPWLVNATGAFSGMAGMVPVQGEVLTVRIPGMCLNKILHRGVFVLPMGGEVYRVGATFRWTDVWGGTSEEARTWLLKKLRAIVAADADVLGQRSGVRPTVRDRRPLLGITAPHRAVFNGLGSRGVLLAPWCADHLIEHLFSNAPLDPDVDQARFR